MHWICKTLRTVFKGRKLNLKLQGKGKAIVKPDEQFTLTDEKLVSKNQEGDRDLSFEETKDHQPPKSSQLLHKY